MWYDKLLENALLPDSSIRQGIRWYNQQHLERLQHTHKTQIFEQLTASALAIETEAANRQHYELPAAFFTQVLGPHLKYSCGYWKTPSVTLAQSEADMLSLSCQRAELQNGQNILELGCGWGSLTLYMAQHYPQSHIHAISNSHSQRAFILARAAERGLNNITIETVDINDFAPNQQFDRIVSVEMFEHMRNYAALFERLARDLKADGKLFIHVFTHKEHAYLFEIEHERDWMAKYFFTGGTMPNRALLPHFARMHDFQQENEWHLNGKHYQRTSNAWLQQMDHHKAHVMPIMAQVYGADQALKWWVYWRVFFMACAELFGHANGEEWGVSHYLFVRKT